MWLCAKNEIPSLATAGSTGDGLAALAKLPLVNPDLVTLDIEMPGMSGLETFVEATSAVRGRPGYIYAAGQADGMYSLKQLER